VGKVENKDSGAWLGGNSKEEKTFDSEKRSGNPCSTSRGEKERGGARKDPFTYKQIGGYCGNTRGQTLIKKKEGG